VNLKELSLLLVLPVLAVSILLSFIRLVIGPTLPDRVVALDLIAAQMMGMIAVYAIATDTPALLEIATILALISFLAAIAFAHYIERGAVQCER
jgi:multicomponent Na+:H+ antiporter subunit F